MYTVTEHQGQAEGRPLGHDGAFLTGAYHSRDIAVFRSESGAQGAGEAAINRREGGTIGTGDLGTHTGTGPSDVIRYTSSLIEGLACEWCGHAVEAERDHYEHAQHSGRVFCSPFCLLDYGQQESRKAASNPTQIGMAL